MAPNSPPKLEWIRKVPNALTLGRICLLLLIIPLYLFEIKALNIVCGVLFLIASVSDYFDGYIARRFNLVTKFGASLDHIADKILSTTCILLIIGSGALYTVMGIILVGREVVISGLRLIAAEQDVTISVNSFGKAKTVALDLGIGCLIVNDAITALPFREVGMVSMWVAIALSTYSAYLYFLGFWPHLKSELKG